MDTLELAASCRLLCPTERYNKDEDRQKIIVNGDSHYIIKSPYYISDVEDKGFYHYLRLWDKKEGEMLLCWACLGDIVSKSYYRCLSCREDYHKECVESPSMFQSFNHPQHSLQLLRFVWENQIDCFSCKNHRGKLIYYCQTCDFMIHPVCARNSTALIIDNHKRHEHILHYFPRRKSTLICDVCGLEDYTDYVYVCLICGFIVHKWCVYLPYVIKVTRHNHRLGFTPNLFKVWTKSNCGICQTKINYGQYSCMKGCAYALHPRCAMRNDVCDGKELEGDPEEAYENLNMYEEKGDGIIQHLSHPHHQMKLDQRNQIIYDEKKYCQACILPLYDDGNSYQCMQCDFILHESCAYIPRVKDFMLHTHPLILEFSNSTSLASCKKCHRYSCGFTYVCRIQMCSWVLDTLCASICEPFDHHTHPHPLFVTCDENTWKECSICQWSREQPLNCGECDFFLCFHCATLPHKVRYENDEHLLTFSYKKDANNDEFYWCEICEEDITPKNGSYACKECGVTLHIDCLLGKDPYMKPGQSRMVVSEGTVRVLPNTCSTRPRCKACKTRCPYKIMIESSSPTKDIYCSFDCYKFFAMVMREASRRRYTENQRRFRESQHHRMRIK